MQQYGLNRRRSVSELEDGDMRPYRRPSGGNNKRFDDEYGKKKSSASALFIVFLLVAALVGGTVIYVKSNYSFIAGKMISVDSTELDLRAANFSEYEELERFEKLRRLDLRENNVTAEKFIRLKEEFPECEILWSVPFSCGSIDCESESVFVPNAVETDIDNLKYMTAMHACDLSGSVLYEKITALPETYPGVDFRWTVDIAGTACPSDTKTVTVKGLPGTEIEKLAYLPQLEYVDASGCTCYDELMEIYRLKGGACRMLWQLDLAGKQVSSEETKLDYSGTKITDYDAFFKNIAYLPKLERVDMVGCGLSDKQMGALADTYTNTRFIWIVKFGRWSLRTDATVFSTLQYDPPTGCLTSDDIQVLKYCTDLEMLDLGHNHITDISCLAGLTKMKVLILADNRISDISPIANMKDLFYVEMFINRISDISVLKDMPKLEQVNFCWNYNISDPTALYDKEKLCRVWMCGTAMTAQTKKEMRAALPKCEFDLTSTWGSTNGSWRHNDTYFKIKDAFKHHSGTTEHYWD